MLPNFRRSKQNAIELQSFKQDQDKKILAYYGQIVINQQKFNVLFDSGSTNVFIMSIECVSKSCLNHHLYRFTDNTDYQNKIIESENQIQYICGKSKGMLIEERVELNRNIKVSGQSIHVGQEVDIAAFIGSKWDGILGLGYYPTVNDNNQQQYQIEQLNSVQQSKLSIIDNIIQQRILKYNQQFFIYSLNSSGGRITFGEYPKQMDRNKIVWQNVDSENINEEVSWVLKLQDVYLQSNTNTKQQQSDQYQQQMFRGDNRLNTYDPMYLNRMQQIKQKQQKVMDVPKTSNHAKFIVQNVDQSNQNINTTANANTKSNTCILMRFLQKKLKTHNTKQKKMKIRSHSHSHSAKTKRKNDLCPDGCKLLIDTGTYLNYIPQEMYRKLMADFDFKTNICKEINLLPDIVFVFENGSEIVLKPSQYLEMYQSEGQKVCTNSFTPDDVENDIITLGQMFLKTFHTVFDFGNKRIGFSSNLNDLS